MSKPSGAAKLRLAVHRLKKAKVTYGDGMGQAVEAYKAKPVEQAIGEIEEVVKELDAKEPSVSSHEHGLEESLWGQAKVLDVRRQTKDGRNRPF